MNDFNEARPFVSLREEAPAYWNLGILWIIHADAAATAGRWSLIEELCGQGTGAPPHVHEWSDETFYIIDGEVTFLIGTETKSVGAGSFISIPRGTVHGFRVDSATCLLLNGYVPASWEAAVVEMAVPALSRTLPPSDLPLPDMQRAKELMARYGMRPAEGSDPLRPT